MCSATSKEIGDSLTLAVFQEPLFADHPIMRNNPPGRPIDVGRMHSAAQAEEFLQYPGGYTEMQEKDRKPSDYHEQLKGIQKAALIWKPGSGNPLAAVQTNRGSWLTVIDSKFVEVKELKQLEGGKHGKIISLWAKTRFDHVQPHIEPSIGKLLTTETGNEGFKRQEFRNYGPEYL